MRINRFIALATGLSRRAADKLADEGEILVNGRPVRAGHEVTESDSITFRGRKLKLPKTQTVMLNKPVGYVSSRNGQGSLTVYDLLPEKLHQLKPVGRLDKDSSGLLLLTNEGELAQKLTHPSNQKEKNYQVELNRLLNKQDYEQIRYPGVDIGDDRLSRFSVSPVKGQGRPRYIVQLTEGRNRQIRRTFDSLGYKVTKLHRISFGDYSLGKLAPGSYAPVKAPKNL